MKVLCGQESWAVYAAISWDLQWMIVHKNLYCEPGMRGLNFLVPPVAYDILETDPSNTGRFLSSVRK